MPNRSLLAALLVALLIAPAFAQTPGMGLLGITSELTPPPQPAAGDPQAQDVEPDPVDEDTGEVYSIYFSEIPLRSDGKWLILTDAPQDEIGREFVEAAKAELTEHGGGGNGWVVIHEANETALHNRMRGFELVKAVIREYRKFDEASWLGKLEQVVAAQHGINVGFVKAGADLVKTAAELGYETSPIRWALKAQSGLQRRALGVVGLERFAQPDPDEVINGVLGRFGYRREDKLTVQNALEMWNGVKDFVKQLRDDPIGTSANMQYVKPLLAIVNAGDRQAQGEAIGEEMFNVVLTVVTVLDLGATAPALAARTFQTINTMARAMMRGVGMVVRLGRAAWAQLRAVPVRFLRGLRALRGLAGRGPGTIAELRAAVQSRQGLLCSRFGRGFCFPPGTLVHTPAGLVAIETLRPGDEVIAREMSTGRSVARPVLQRFVSVARTLRTLTVRRTAAAAACGAPGLPGFDAPLAREHLTATGEHPFWSPVANRWATTDELAAGARLLLGDGSEAEVMSVAVESRLTPVHNVEVGVDHNYYVGRLAVLSHNAGPDVDCRSFNDAMSKALDWLSQRGFTGAEAVPHPGRFTGELNGLKTRTGNIGYRIEFDARSGAHINVFSGKEKGPHFKWPGNEKEVNTILRRLFCR